jgi:hypothetical protein
MKKLSDIENLEFTREDISLVGLIFLAFISLLHTCATGLFIAIPVMAVLIFVIAHRYIKNLFEYLKESKKS